MENLEVLDANMGPLVDRSMQSWNRLKNGDDLEIDSALDKKVLEDLDSYWDDLNTRLIVSRMVSNCIIRGIANAIGEEAADNIASKEAEVAFLNKRLDCYKLISTGSNGLELAVLFPEPSIVKEEPLKTKLESNQCIPDTEYQRNYNEHLSRLKIAAQGQLQMLKKEIVNTKVTKSLTHQGKVEENLPIIDGYVNGLELILGAIYNHIDIMLSSLKYSPSDELWEHEFQREFKAIMFQGFMTALQDEYEKKLCDQRSQISTLNKILRQKVEKLSDFRQELGAISSSLNCSETWVLFSHNSIENTEEWSGSKRKDHFTQSEVGNHHLLSRSDTNKESSLLTDKFEESLNVKTELGSSRHLKSMENEELIAYFKTEINKMKRQHELALQEKTEELFSLKREYMKEKGANFSHFRNNKEFELLRKKIPELILKLDDILLEKDKAPSVEGDQDMFYGLKERINNLLVENERLHSLLTDKSKEVKYLSSQVHAANQMSNHPLVEASFREQIDNLKSEMENLKIEASIRNEVHSTAMKELVDKHATEMEALQIEIRNSQDIYSIISRAAVENAMSIINATIAHYHGEKDSFAKLLSEKERTLCLQVEEKKKLEVLIASLSTLVEEKEKLASESGSSLERQNEHLNKMHQQLTVLREQVSEQEILLCESKRESNLSRCRLDETLQQIHHYEVEANELKLSIRVLYKGLEEAKQQKSVLEDIIQEKENMLSSFIGRENEQKQHMKFLMSYLSELSKAFANLESGLTCKIEQNQSRLNILSGQCHQLVQQANLQKKTGVLWGKMYDRKCSDLQKAESEVDLLGNDVDTLMSLLEMIYIALDHYSPVFKYYPAVMEILEFTGRELKKRYGKNIGD